MLPTYVALPLIASALFLAPAIPAMAAIAHSSPLAAVTLGALWLLLLITMLRDNAELRPVLAGVATLLFSRAIGSWIAGGAGWSAPMGRMAVVLAVMGVLAAFNTVRISRDRGTR